MERVLQSGIHGYRKRGLGGRGQAYSHGNHDDGLSWIIWQMERVLQSGIHGYRKRGLGERIQPAGTQTTPTMVHRVPRQWCLIENNFGRVVRGER